MESDLTQKQRNFALAYVGTACGKGSEAYRSSHDAQNMTAKAIAVEASRLLRNPKVTLIIKDLRRVARGQALLTLEGHLTELAAIRDEAKKHKQFSAAVRAEELRGRLSGLQPSDNEPEEQQTCQPGRPEEAKHDHLAAMFEKFYGGLKVAETDKPKAMPDMGLNRHATPAAPKKIFRSARDHAHHLTGLERDIRAGRLGSSRRDEGDGDYSQRSEPLQHKRAGSPYCYRSAACVRNGAPVGGYQLIFPGPPLIVPLMVSSETTPRACRLP